MKKLMVGAVSALALSAGSAFAADVAPILKAPKLAMAPIPTWAGFYIGANAGGGYAIANEFDPDCSFCNSITFHKGFGEIGGQLGYNWQSGHTVLGVEGDINGSSLKATSLIEGKEIAQVKMDAFSSVRARAGLAFDHTLVYVTAGPAWGHFDSLSTQFTTSALTTVARVAPDHAWHSGIAAGAGIEQMLTPSWTVRGEFLYLDFVDSLVNFQPTAAGNPGTAKFRKNFSYSAEVARLGLSYRLDGGGEPVMAHTAGAFKAPAGALPAAGAGWAGLYVGANAGGGIAEGQFLDPDCFTCADATFHRMFGTVGGQAGYNAQWGAAVLGLEGDLDWASLNESGLLALDQTSEPGTTRFKMDAFASIRARAGLAVDRTLVYVTAGPAWGHFDSLTTLFTSLAMTTIADTAPDQGWHAGLAAGAGMEFMLTPNWSVRGEYLYLMFADANSFLQPTAAGQPGDAKSRVNYGYAAQIARVGANYHFDPHGGTGGSAPMTYKAPAVANWVGFYLGASVGGGIANGDFMDMDCYTCSDATYHRAFGTVGGQLGFNWQSGATVIGLEGDLNWANVNESGQLSLAQSREESTTQLKFDAFASIRGRAGLAVGDTLVYVTAGPVWGHFKENTKSIPTSTDLFTVADDSWRFGLAGGAGLEYLLSRNLSLRGEYLYLNFVDKIAACVPLSAQAVSFNCSTQFHMNYVNSAQIARIGLDYKLDWAGPNVMRY